jgi:hypothetical protein
MTTPFSVPTTNTARHHLYYPIVKNGHALLTAARISLLQPGTTIPIVQDIWVGPDSFEVLPNPWTASPAIIDVWFTTPLRLRLKIEEYLGDTYYYENLDVLPSAQEVVISTRSLRIDTGWHVYGMLTALTSGEAAWSAVNVVTPADLPVLVTPAALGAGEGDPVPPPYVNQTLNWTRHVADASQGYGPPTEEIHFRVNSTTYIRLGVFVDPEGQTPQTVCQQYVSGVLTNTYFNTNPANIAFPVDGEAMQATITDDAVNLYQGSVSTTVPVASFVVDITNDTGHTFLSTHLDNSTPSNIIDDTSATSSVWS